MGNFFASNLKDFRQKRGMSKSSLAKKIGVHQSTITRWENEDMGATIDNAIDISNVLNVSLAELVGKDLSMDNIKLVDLPTNTVKIPILGKVPAGVPIEAIEDIIGYEEIPTSWTKGNKKWFGLQISGDSMEPTYNDKDIIIVLQTSDFESSQDCIVIVNGSDGIFKRVIKQDDSIILKSLNCNYDPIVYTSKDIIEKPVNIIGIAKEIRRKVN